MATNVGSLENFNYILTSQVVHLSVHNSAALLWNCKINVVFCMKIYYVDLSSNIFYFAMDYYKFFLAIRRATIPNGLNPDVVPFIWHFDYVRSSRC